MGEAVRPGRVVPAPALAMVLAFLCFPALAQDREEVVWASLTNHAAAVVEWQPAYAFAVAAGPGGSVEGTANGWHDEGTTVSNRAVAADACAFAGWLNAPEGLEMDNPLVFALDGPWTNLLASFAVAPGAVAAAPLPPGAGPGLAAAPPEGLAVKVQRASRLDDPDWQEVGEITAETGVWSDDPPPADWRQLFYRLAE